VFLRLPGLLTRSIYARDFDSFRLGKRSGVWINWWGFFLWAPGAMLGGGTRVIPRDRLPPVWTAW